MKKPRDVGRVGPRTCDTNGRKYGIMIHCHFPKLHNPSLETFVKFLDPGSKNNGQDLESDDTFLPFDTVKSLRPESWNHFHIRAVLGGLHTGTRGATWYQPTGNLNAINS
jgi:hypothetical protein